MVGNLEVLQNDTGNTENSVFGIIRQGNGASYVAGTRGDFGLRFDGATPADDVRNGVLMVSIRENGRSNEGEVPSPIGAGLGYATPAIQAPANLGAGNTNYPGYSTAISVSNTPISGIATGGEWNANQSFAYFRYSEWLGGWVTNNVNNGPLTRFESGNPGFSVSSGTNDTGTATVFDSTATAGIYKLRLSNRMAPRGTNSSVAATSQNGILLVTGGRNEDNYALSEANADGTFTLICKDNGTDTTSFENDGVAFVYIPTGHSDVAAMGRIDAEGDAVANSGDFTVTKGPTGKWFLSSPGRNDSNSVLIISPEGATTSGTNRADNIWSFSWDEANAHWVIESRDLSANATITPPLQNLNANEPAFSFALFESPGTPPFSRNIPPTIDPVSPAIEEHNAPREVALTVDAHDLNGDALNITYYGRKISNVGSEDDFTIIALPDTQFYSQDTGGNRASIFSAQTDWIVAQREALNIGMVLHLGDITQYGDRPDTAAQEWINASNAMYRLEDPATTNLPDGIPYVLAVGNHDQYPMGDADGTSIFFNTYFGVHPVTGINHFDGKSYYGGTSHPSSADNNYVLFSAGGMDFIVISLEYDTTPDTEDLAWADGLLKQYSSRRGIVITHHTVNTGNPASFSTQGAAIYNALKNNPNLMLMHGGHIHGEGRRTDIHEGRPVHSLLADFQSRANGGDGWLRIMKFRPLLNRIDIQTYSPTRDLFETDDNSQFSLPVDLTRGVGPFIKIGEKSGASGTFLVNWSGLEEGARYEWYAEVSDGTTTVRTNPRAFSTKGVIPPTASFTGPANGTVYHAPASIPLEVTASDVDGSISKVEFFSGTQLLGTVTTPPYRFDWTTQVAGNHTIIAKATDNDGNVSPAPPVTIQVISEPGTPDVSNISTGLFNPNWVIAATTPSPRHFVSPGNNTGDIQIRNTRGRLPFSAGATLTANWDNPGAGNASAKDNIIAAYSDDTGGTWVNVLTNATNNTATANPATSEESSGAAVAYLPYAAGFTGASVNAEGQILSGNLPIGTSVYRTGTGLYHIHGLPLTGNLLAFTNGNSGTDADNVLSIRKLSDAWLVDTRDNSSDGQSGSFTFVYIPETTPGIYSGRIEADGSFQALNGALATLGAKVTRASTYLEIVFGDGSQINPANTALFITADATSNSAGADNLTSYHSQGNAFRVFSQDLPQLSGSFQSIDFRFVAIPFDLQGFSVPTVSIRSTDNTAGEFGPDQSLSFTVTRTGSTTHPLTLQYSVSGATSGADFIALPGSIEIPVSSASAVIPVTVLPDDEIEGTEILTLTLAESPDYRIVDGKSASGMIFDRPFHAFLKQRGLSGGAHDDGAANLLEYYMGSSADDVSSRGTVTAVSAYSGTFIARFPRSKSAVDVTGEIQWSTDMKTWHRSGESNGSQIATIEMQPVSATSEDPEIIEAKLSIQEGPTPASVFLRIAVTP